MVLPLSCFRRIQFGAFGGKGVTEHSFYFCPRFQNDTGSEVWGFCVFYRQDAGIGFLPCCKWRSVSAHRSLTRLIHLFIAKLFVRKLEELIPQLKIFAETFSVYFLQRYPSGTFYMFYFNFFCL